MGKGVVDQYLVKHWFSLAGRRPAGQDDAILLIVIIIITILLIIIVIIISIIMYQYILTRQSRQSIKP